MRNIHLNCHLKTAISSASGDFKLDTKNFNFHVASSGAVVIYSSGNVLSLQNDLINEISISEALQAENVSHDKLAGLEVTSEGNFILATQKDGVILSIGPDGPTVMGQVDAGIVGLSQSPDEELFLIVTDAATLIIMTRDFEPLTEVPLEPSDPTFKGEQEQINVGWGAKETQFHGSAGKTAAKASGPPLVPIGPHDDRKVRIAWKEDGQHFALSHVSKSEAGIEVRRIRIFNREGVLQSTSEDVSGLEHCLAWKPSGSLIASTVRLPNKHQVQFFEPNGLRHGEFTLQFPVNSVTVHSLAWNVDSTILMVLASDIASPDTFHLQLWTCSNYKWSLKKSWTEDQPIIGVQWDEISPFKLHFVTADSLYHRLDLTTTIDHSNGVDEADVAFVANVDGNVIGLTPFRQTVIPPPLNAFELRFRSKVSQVMFAPPCDLNSNSVMILTDNHELFIFGPDKNESLQKELEDAVQITGAGGRGFTVKCICLHPSAKLSVKFDDDDLTNFCWIRKNILLASKNQPMSELIIFKLEKEEFSIAETLSCEEAIFSISPSICGNVAAIQMIDGSILKLTLGDDDYFELLPWTSIETGEAVKFPTVCSQLKVAHCPLAGNGHRIFGLSTRNRLYCDDVEIATGINSFFVHSNYLLATTLSHTLKAVPLTKSIFDQKISPETFWNAESVRSVERGSRLIVSVPEHTQTVLQLPRGNLEVIHPRALALHIVKKLLNQLKYKETMNILRRERINLNLIVDHNPELFVSNIDKFVEQIVDKQRLCLFLSDLQEEDTTTTMYKSMYTDTKPYTWSNGKKVDVVCTMMQQVLEKDLEANFLPIISCLVRNSLSKNESALLKIQAMRETNPRLADEGLNFLLLLVDVQVLFDAALGLYDFDLVLFVTQRSQKDPKEYLQFLNELKRFPEDYRKFKIDSHLKKFDTALVHLVDCGEGYLEECLSLVMHHRLYSQALDIFKPDTRGYKEICRVYGDYLLSKKYFEDAALIYEKGLLTSQAIEAWEKAVNPSYCLAAAKMLNLSPNEMTSLYRRLVSRLVDEKRHTEASNLLVEYLDDVEEAVAVLVGGLCWSEAQRLISKHSRHDLSETHLIPKLKETAELTLATINRNRQSLIEQVDRLQRVMETKQKISDGLFDEVDVNLDDIDLYSDVTSHTGILSQQTRLKSNPASLKTRASSQRSKSSKNRRKHEKKKYSTREGSTFEDIALIAALHELITKVYAMTGDIAKLNRALFHHGEILAARTIQQDFENLLNVIFAREAKIWMESVSVSGDDTEEHKFGPEATIADIIQNNTQQKPASPPYHLLEIRQRFPPARPSSDSWKLVILSK